MSKFMLFIMSGIELTIAVLYLQWTALDAAYKMLGLSLNCI